MFKCKSRKGRNVLFPPGSLALENYRSLMIIGASVGNEPSLLLWLRAVQASTSYGQQHNSGLQLQFVNSAVDDEIMDRPGAIAGKLQQGSTSIPSIMQATPVLPSPWVLWALEVVSGYI